MHVVKPLLSATMIGLASLATAPGLAQSAPPPSGPVSNGSPPPSSWDCSPEQIEHNKYLATLFRLDGDPAEAYENMAPDYIQHNPVAYRMGQVNGVSGRDEFQLLIDMKDKGFGGPRPALPGQPPEDTYHFVLASCNYVFLLKQSFPPDPQHEGQYYETFAFDLWRVEDGKLAEHWDNGRIPEPVPPMIQIPFSQMTPLPQPTE